MEIRLTGQSTPASITPARASKDLSDPWRPARLRPVHGWRVLKRWRYVGVFSDELMACAARVQIGPARQSFWALHLRGGEILRERTRTLIGRGAVALNEGALRVADAGVSLELQLEEAAPIHARCLHQGGKVWTRKQAGVVANGTLALDGGARRAIEALAVIDDTAGYHAHRTEWWWSAGVGAGSDGRALAWNLVSGVNDPERGSERAVWVDGEPHECAPVRFSDDLREIACEDGARLRFSAEAERSRTENLLIVKSDYRAPFGTFAGTLPGGGEASGPIALAHGLGVVEHHRARW
jgi:Protein of unknown function (DUF2804)